MRKHLTFLAALVAVTAVVVMPAGAITNGDPDVDGHPFVGLMVAKNAAGVPLWQCSGTLMSPTVFMVAGHCAEAPATSAVIWFSNGLPSGIPLGMDAAGRPFPVPGADPCAGISGYPCTGDATGSELSTHPEYDTDSFFLHDLGVVTLDAAVTDPAVTADGFGALPTLGALSGLPKHSSVTSVGYGDQRAFPEAASRKDQALRIRMVAHPRILAIDDKTVGDFAILISHDASRGGICAGDSGGPNFIGDTNVVGAVSSFGQLDNCKGRNGAYRIDQADDLDWLRTAFGLTP